MASWACSEPLSLPLGSLYVPDTEFNECQRFFLTFKLMPVEEECASRVKDSQS